MMRIGIIILNYLAYKTTIETVDSFLKQTADDAEIKFLIVDNGSTNNSYEKLFEYYKNIDTIVVKKTENNLGFAKGNNFGYQELLKDFDPDFTIISNDDILLPKDGLYKWIRSCYDKYSFAVMGCDVFSINGDFHQSPIDNFSRDIKECERKMLELRKKYIKCLIKKILRYSKYTGYPKWENKYFKEVHDDKTLHGSFQIFSKLYFEKYSVPYDDSTFLYMEEDILRLRCDNVGLRMIYDPSYQVHHLQAVATNMINKNHYDKQLFRYKEIIKSLKIYMNILKSNTN